MIDGVVCASVVVCLADWKRRVYDFGGKKRKEVGSVYYFRVFCNLYIICIVQKDKKVNNWA